MSISAKSRLTARIAFGLVVALSYYWPWGFAAADEAADEQRVDVTFITNRGLDEGGSGADLFNNELGVMSAGRCVVDVAARSGRGELSNASAMAIEALLDDMEEYEEEGLVVYIHGYYEDFERSCRRAAVFKNNLNLSRGFLLFSWPANSNPVTYAADVQDMAASTPQFLNFLQQLSTHVEAGKISIVGHSLGTRGLVKALESAPEPIPGTLFRDLILIASDMERTQFVDALPELRKRVSSITILVSDRDLALRVSRAVNGAERLGQVGEATFEGVEVIDVTDVANTHLSGHVYHLRNDRVIDDLQRLLAP